MAAARPWIPRSSSRRSRLQPLYRARMARGLNILALARLVGVTSTYLGDVERLQKPLSPKLAELLSIELDTPMDELLECAFPGNNGYTEAMEHWVERTRARLEGADLAPFQKYNITPEELRSIMQSLYPRERRVLFLLVEEGITGEAAGNEFGLTRTRMYQMRDGALLKLRRWVERISTLRDRHCEKSADRLIAELANPSWPLKGPTFVPIKSRRWRPRDRKFIKVPPWSLLPGLF